MPATTEPAGNLPLQDQVAASGEPSGHETVVLRPKDFDALVERLDQAGGYDPRVARVLSRKAPWD